MGFVQYGYIWLIWSLSSLLFFFFLVEKFRWFRVCRIRFFGLELSYIHIYHFFFPSLVYWSFFIVWFSGKLGCKLVLLGIAVWNSWFSEFPSSFFFLWILSNQTEHGGKSLGFLQEMKHAGYFLALKCSTYGVTNTKIKTLRCCLELIMVIW